MDAITVEKIPGMIEPVERTMLYDLARQVALRPGDAMVEFGTFFGRSTHCLAQGIAANATRDASHRLYAYDNFRCAKDGMLSPHVLAHAKRGGVTELLREEADATLNFRPVFSHYLKSYIDAGLVVPVQAELSESEPPEGALALMHIDSPKFYAEFRDILFRFFPRVRDGAVVVFQDFFYHWSATLIAAAMAMSERGLLTLEGSAASSLVTRVRAVPNSEDIAAVDAQMQEPKTITKLLQAAVRACQGMTMDRREVFLPRLLMAQFQYLWAQGEYEAATEVFAGYFNGGNKVTRPVVNDFLEMLRKGFDLRTQYALDHCNPSSIAVTKPATLR